MKTIHDEVEAAAQEVERRKASRPRIEWVCRYDVHSATVCGIALEVAWQNGYGGHGFALNGRWQAETFADLEAAKAAAVAGLRTLATDILWATEGKR